MRTIKFFSIIFLIILLISSCEKKYYITKTFKDKILDKPVKGLIVGLYKFDKWLSYNKSIDSVELISIASTDSLGRVIFELEDENIQNYFFNPIRATDSTSVNAKYNVKFSDNLPTATWDLNCVIYLYSQYNIKLRIKDMQMGDNLNVMYEGDIFNMLFDGKPYFGILLNPGQYYSLDFYKKIGDQLEFIESKRIYVKYQQNTSKNIFSLEIPYAEIYMELTK